MKAASWGMAALVWSASPASAELIASADCPIEKTVYALADTPGITAGFARQVVQTSFASDLVFWLKTPRRTFWFSFNAPNGYGGTSISPDIDPALAREPTDAELDARDAAESVPDAPEPEYLGFDFDAFDGSLDVYDNPPQSDDLAPALLFARGLGPALWYNPAGVAGTDAKVAAESIPIGFWRPAECKA